jgi:ATP-binding cassette, subfamily B (MDR/TAP), member 1
MTQRSLSWQRIFAYTDRVGWCLNAVAFVCVVASGTLLPLMDLVFGKFVTVVNNYAIGQATADDYRSSINTYT